MWPQDVVGALDQQTSQIGIAGLGDAELRIAFARLTAFWPEPKIATNVSTTSEPTLIPERQHEGKRGDVADSMNRHHGLGLGILGLSQPLDIPVVLLDLERHLRDLGKDRIECQLQPWRHRGVSSLSEALRGRSRHTVTPSLRQPTNRVHCSGSQSDQ